MDSHTLIKQLGLMVAGRILPSESALADITDNARKGLLLTVIGGVLAAACILLISFGIYTALLAEGLSLMTTLIITTALLALSAALCLTMASNATSKLSKAKQKIQQSSPLQSNDFDISHIVGAFMDGLNTPTTKADEEELVKTYQVYPATEPTIVTKTH